MDDIVFVGDWVKDRVLGSGSFGIVVLWKHKHNEEKLAIKICKWGDELTAKHRERWTKEVEMLQTCNHPNIVCTKHIPSEFDTGLSKANPSKLPILCMEYCSGGDLRQLLNKPDASCGLKETKVRKILNDIGSAMKFLHTYKITHRDLKPENIVVHLPNGMPEASEDKVTYKIIDLGYAKEIDSNSICASFVGTLQYLAPELFYSKTYSNSVDFWSFGLLAFEIICGTRPFLPFKAPVEWMPFVKQKLHENICIYETFHGDIEYSNEIFLENHISKPFKALIEQWLKVALEWDPKLRGRDSPSKVTFNIPSENKGTSITSKVIIFDMLQSILEKKIIKVFCVPTITNVSYEISDTDTIDNLKRWITKDINIPSEELIIISRSHCNEIGNEEKIIEYWNENNIVLFIYDKKQMIPEKISPIVPIAVQRCLEHPKALYNFKNSQTLYRHAFFFILTQMESYDSLITALFTRSESLKQESKQLLIKHNNVDKSLGKLLAKLECIKAMIKVGKKHIEDLIQKGTGTNLLGGFGKIFKDSNDLMDKVDKLTTAWSQLSVRLQSAARRSNEGISKDLDVFIAKYNYQNIFSKLYTTFISYNKSDFYNNNREKEKPCPDIVKVCYDSLKFRSRTLQELQHQQFLLKLKDVSVELSKIAGIISTAEENTGRLHTDLTILTEQFSTCIWSTISVVVTEADIISDLPYSVVSFEKKDFKIEGPVTNYTSPHHNYIQTNGNSDVAKSLVTESLKLRQNQMTLCEKLNNQKKALQNSLEFDFLYDDDSMN
ncbi:unnamed protein product [Leptidea sinapis]|uniref:IkappaB kinase n=1 Tax=Leptidea sinapis TaxID=189913 RepID=A0A5E4R0E3_9NEOP|nr:unnamed protein product [Leptidea sinapis]